LKKLSLGMGLVVLTYFVFAEAGHTADSVNTQRLQCNTGYTLSECSRQLSLLRATLAMYHAETLAPWTWVLVKSQDWKFIVRSLRGNTDSPAFSDLERRVTFLEEALFVQVAGRSAELLRVWSVPLDRLLLLAVTHELGHAMCDELDEAKADKFGVLLRQGREAKCAGGSSSRGKWVKR